MILLMVWQWFQLDSVDLFLDNDPEENLTSEATMIYGISLLPNHVIRWPPKIGRRWMARGSLSITKKDMTRKKHGLP